VVDFLGGGIRHNLLSKKYEGNIIVAINAEIRELMKADIVYINESASLDSALKLMYEKGVGGLPIVDNEIGMKGIITEQDFVSLLSGVKTGLTVESFLSSNVVTANSKTPIRDATKMIVQRGFRRLPVVQDGVLTGVITAFDIMRYLGSGAAFKKVVTGDIHEVMEQPIKILIEKELVCIGPEKDLGEAAEIMVDRDVGSLPVIDKGSLVGILTERDFIRALAEHRG
jgi:CBS domain-containing protein